jgi:hypothetical protein
VHDFELEALELIHKILRCVGKKVNTGVGCMFHHIFSW